MKTTAFRALLFGSTLAAGTAAAQPAPFNETGVTMGHWHLASKDVEANKKIFLGMGGKLFTPGGNPLMMFPGTYINLNLGTEKGEGGSRGSVVNHVGFIVNNVQERVAQWKAAGVAVLLLLPLAYFYGGKVYRIATNQGELVIESDDPNLVVTIKGKTVVRTGTLAYTFAKHGEEWKVEAQAWGRTS